MSFSIEKGIFFMKDFLKKQRAIHNAICATDVRLSIRVSPCKKNFLPQSHPRNYLKSDL
jgi:hypothetical protein